MPATPSISIIMASRGEAPFLGLAVESILAQTHADFEYIIVTNGLAPEPIAYLTSINDPRIHLIHNTENIGLTRALNQALAVARGHYIARMDDDDIALSERLTIQKSYLDTHPDVAVVGTAIVLIDAQGVERGQKAALEDPALLAFRQLTLNQLVHSSVMFRRDVFMDMGGYNESFIYTQDYEAWSRLIRAGHSVTNINQPLLKYRLHGSSTTSSTSTKDRAYELAMRTTRANVERYVPMSDATFETFCAAYYRDSIPTSAALTTTLRLWDRLETAYCTKEHPAAHTVSHIHAFVASQKRRATRWYYRRRFATLFGIASMLKKSLTHYL